MAAYPLERGPGAYILVISLKRLRIIEIGRQGRYHFPAGFYLYSGSALGPGGLAARLTRHLRADKRLHWHVDYLLQHARVVEVWTCPGLARRECEWARAALQMSQASIVAPRFGASDCKCASHLIAFDKRPDRKRFAALAGNEVGHWRVK